MSKNHSHDEALDALCGCASTVTVLSYEEAIKGYFSLRGWPDPETLSTLTPARAEGFKAELAAIADNLVDQRDEPWTEEGGASQARVHFWRDKAIDASRAIRALKESPDHG